MKQRDRYYRTAPSPEELAAFLDGELDPALRVRVEEWLGDHADESAELDELRRLGAAVRTTGPAEPGEAAWSAVFDRIEAAAAQAQFWRRAALTGVAAAVLLLSLLLTRPVDRGPVPGDTADPLILATHDDVEIISMHGGDTHALIVGHPPLRDPLVLADPEDISIDGVEPDATSGMMPSVRWVPGGGDAPVVVAILPRPEEDE